MSYPPGVIEINIIIITSIISPAASSAIGMACSWHPSATSPFILLPLSQSCSSHSKNLCTSKITVCINKVIMRMYHLLLIYILVDEEETEQRRMKYKEDIIDLEKQFSDLKEQ